MALTTILINEKRKLFFATQHRVNSANWFHRQYWPQLVIQFILTLIYTVQLFPNLKSFQKECSILYEITRLLAVLLFIFENEFIIGKIIFSGALLHCCSEGVTFGTQIKIIFGYKPTTTANVSFS